MLLLKTWGYSMNFTKINSVTSAVQDKKMKQEAKLIGLKERKKELTFELNELEASITLLNLDIAELDAYEEKK